MKKMFLPALPILAAFSCHAQWDYPPTKTVDVSDTYFGKTYNDPYRWLEDLKDKDVIAWFKAQAELTDDVLAKIPGRDALVQEWLALDKLKPAAYSDIIYENGRVFYKKTLGGENVGKLYFRQGWNGTEKLLFDPTTYKAGVTSTIQSILPSFDGGHVAIGISQGGAEIGEIRVLDVDKIQLLPDVIDGSYGPMSWTLDSKSFLYDSGKTGNPQEVEFHLNRKTRLHRLETTPGTDPDFFSDEKNPELDIHPEEFPSVIIDESYPGYFIGYASTAQNEMRIFYAPVSELKHQKIKWDVLCKPSDNLVRGLEFHGDYTYAVTHTDAPKYKLVRTSVKHPDWTHAETVIPEGADSIQSITKCRHYLLVVYSDGVICRLVKYNFATGKTAEVTLPASGTVTVNCPDWKTDRCLVGITSWTSPRRIYDFDAQQDIFAKSIFDTAVTYPGFENLVSEEVTAPGHDGTMIPLSIIYKKGISLDGSNCCILTGYGAYGYSYTPQFQHS